MSVSGRLAKSFYIHTTEQSICTQKNKTDLQIRKNIKIQKFKIASCKNGIYSIIPFLFQKLFNTVLYDVSVVYVGKNKTK